MESQSPKLSKENERNLKKDESGPIYLMFSEYGPQLQKLTEVTKTYL